MKVLLATNSFRPADNEGGPAFSNYYLARALAGLGSDVWVVTTDRNGPARLSVPLNRWSTFDGLHVHYSSTLSGSWILSGAYGRAISEIAPEMSAAILSGVFWNFTGLAAWRACRRHHVPFVTMPRGLLSPWAIAHKGAKKRIYWTLVARRLVSESAAVIALAEQEAADVRAVGLRVPVAVIPNGAELEGLEDEPDGGAQWRPKGSPYVLFLGRIHEKKGLDILVSAFDLVARRYPNVRLLIAGSIHPGYEVRTQALVAGCSARDRVEFLGNVSGYRKAALLTNAAVFALTSHSEGLPMAVLEALAAGVPVVVTRGCNLPEVASHRAGFEVEGDPNDVARAMETLLARPEVRAEMAANARALAQEKFSWRAVGRQVHDLLARCQANG